MSKVNRKPQAGGIGKKDAFLLPWWEVEENLSKNPGLNPVFPYSMIQFDPTYFGAVLSTINHGFRNPNKIPPEGSPSDTIPNSPSAPPTSTGRNR